MANPCELLKEQFLIEQERQIKWQTNSICLQLKNMNLTNNYQSFNNSNDKSISTLNYITQEDGFNFFTYSPSYNQTFLLEQAPTQENSTISIFKTQSTEKTCSLKNSKEHLHFCDIIDDFQITLNEDLTNQNKSNKIISKSESLQLLLSQLIETVRSLQKKMTMIQGKEQNTKDKSNKPSSMNSQRQQHLMSSTQSYSQTSRTRKCQCYNKQDFYGQKSMMKTIVEMIQSKSKINVYKEQMQRMKKQLIKSELVNEQNAKKIKKLVGQNIKYKQLIKQYQIYFKKSHLNQKNQVKDEMENFQKPISQILQFEFRKSLYNDKQESINLSFSQNFTKKQIYKQNSTSRNSTNFEVNHSIVNKYTPKTPNNYSLTQKAKHYPQKTQLKSNPKTGQLKNILQFSKACQYTQSTHSILPNQRYSNQRIYPFHQLLQEQLENQTQIQNRYKDKSLINTKRQIEERNTFLPSDFKKINQQKTAFKQNICPN